MANVSPETLPLKCIIQGGGLTTVYNFMFLESTGSIVETVFDDFDVASAANLMIIQAIIDY